MLLCLVDIEQRPSRRIARLLIERQEALREKAITLVVLQAAVISPDSWESWKSDSGVKCAVGRLEQNSAKVNWITGVEALPWLILTDANGSVTAEGFPLDELDAKLGALAR